MFDDVEGALNENGEKLFNINAMIEDEQTYLEEEEYKKPITVDDIIVLRKIGRKSINDFTPEELKITQKWAYKFYHQMGTKSPFFRAWFGDWRAYDNTSVKSITATSNGKSFTNANEGSIYIKNGIKNKTLFRGDIINQDTRFKVNVGAQVYNDTLTYANRGLSRDGNKSKSDLLVKYNDTISILGKIKQICENSVLLDTVVAKSEEYSDQSFFHHFYCLTNVEGRTYIVNLMVDELNSLHGDIRRAYNVNTIKITPVAVSQVYKPAFTTDANGSITSVSSISDLYSLVKQYEKDFHPGKSVNPVLLNDDGTPRKFYHGTRDSFTVFDKSKRGSNTKTAISKNWFFAADKDTAKSYYPYGVMEYLFNKTGQEQYNPEKLPASRRGNLYELYISAKNPLVVDVADYDYDAHREKVDALVEFTEQADKNGNDAIIFINALDNQLETSKRESTVVLFRESNQVKSATDNIGTFDGSNDDIRYSITIDNFNAERYNETDIPHKEKVSLLSEAMTWNADKIDKPFFVRKYGYVYTCIFDKDHDLYVVGKTKAVNIYDVAKEINGNDGLTSDFDKGLILSRNERRSGFGSNIVLENGRTATRDEGVLDRTISETQQGDRGRSYESSSDSYSNIEAELNDSAFSMPETEYSIDEEQPNIPKGMQERQFAKSRREGKDLNDEMQEELKDLPRQRKSVRVCADL